MITRPTHARSKSCALALAFALLCTAFGLSAETLQNTSPFLPPGYGKDEEPPPPPPPPSQGPLSREIEFRSVIQFGDTYQFSLFSKKENKGYWIEEGATVSGIRASGFNPANSTLIVTKNGRSERLTIVSASDSPLPVAVSTASGNSRKTPPRREQPKAEEPGEKRRRVPRRRVILPKSE